MEKRVVALVLLTAGAHAQDLTGLPVYEPERKVRGTIRVWGHGSPTHNFMGAMFTAWTTGFAHYQPEMTFENKMYGTASSIGALYTGAGDLAIRGEEIHPFEIAAFQRVMHYPPSSVEIATGSLDVRNMDFAFVIFVHKDNPLTRISLTQLEGVLGSEHRRGGRNIRTWRELGVQGEIADHPIAVYSWKLDDDFSSFLQEAVLDGSHRWNCAIREYAHITRPDGSIYDSGQQILDAVGADPYGLGISSVRYKNSTVKPLALASTDNGPYYQATKETLVNRQYPLTRFIPAFFNRAPGKPVDPKIKEFLRYILSREGQQAIVRTNGYLPMNADAVREQLKKLE